MIKTVLIAKVAAQGLPKTTDASAPPNKCPLLSPGAPSFPRYVDYVERGRHFATLAGFDANAISAIAGLGIA